MLLQAVDRFWWSRTIRRADVVDAEFAALQLGRRVSTRGAIKAYVSGGFRTGLTLNALFTEHLVSRQLPDAERVPALYAYLVTDPAHIETSLAWDAPAYAASHASGLPGGPLRQAWRSLTSGASVTLRGGHTVDLAELHSTAARSLAHDPVGNIPASATTLIWELSQEDEDGEGLRAPLSVTLGANGVGAGAPLLVLMLPPSAPASIRILASQLALGCTAIHVATAAPAISSGGLMAHRKVGAVISSPTLTSLLAAADAGPVAPLWLSPDGTIVSAGLLMHDGHPYRALSGHPVEDARALGVELVVSDIDSPIRAMRVGDRRAPRTLLREVVMDTVVSTALAAHEPGASAVVRPVPVPRGLRLSAWKNGAPHYEKAPERMRLPDGAEVPRLRWAIKTAAPAGPLGESWGETHFARALADALERLGQYVAVDSRPALSRRTSDLDDVVLALRGPHPLLPPAAPHTLLWVISHPDEITAEELAAYDLVFAASGGWARAASDRFGVSIRPLLQCTDATRFRPAGIAHGRDLVFVGTARGIARPSVVEPIRAGVPVRVYGPDWRGYIPGQAIAATHVTNDELPRLYESAGAVLNDHWPAMRREGFVSNRLFDVVAAGGRAISDDVAGISDLFGEAVRTYTNVPELTRLVTQEVSALFPSDASLRPIGARVRAEHSFDARAAELLQAVMSRRHTEAK